MLKRLINIREQVLRVCVHPEVIRMRPNYFNNRLQQLLIMSLRDKTSELNGDEKFKEMNVQAKVIYDTLGTAIEELEMD